MKKIAVALGVIVVVLIAAVLIGPMLVPLETYKDEISAQAKDATGRDFFIDGDMSLALLPRVELEVNEVRFGNADGAAEPEMMTLKQLVFVLEFWPLLGGAIEIDRFVLVEPVIHLEVAADGTPNWEFGEAEAPAEETAEAEGADFDLASIALGDVRIVDGLLTYRDAASGADYRVEDINMSLNLPTFDSALTAKGGLALNGENFNLDATLATPARLVAGDETAIAAKVSSKLATLAFDGRAKLAEAVRADGAVDLDVPSLRRLAAWAGAPLDVPGSGFGPLRVKGRVDVQGERYGFSDATIEFDEIEGTGALLVDLDAAKPYVEARLDVDRLDVTPYLPGDSTTQEGAAAAQEWSDEPIDMSALHLVNADLGFSANAIQVRDIRIDRSAVSLRIEDGVATVTLAELSLYEGSGTALVHADARGDAPKVDMTVNLQGVQAEPLGRDAAGFDRVSGSAVVEMKIAATGRSQREMVGAVDGAGSVKFIDGAIKGLDIGSMVRNVTAAFAGGGETRRKTDFAEMSGSFTIADGILTNNDLKLLAPLLRVTGAGTVDLPMRTVDYRIEPKLAATAEGQGGTENVAGIMVPVIVDGPWHDISYRPDLAAMITAAPKAAVGVVKGVAEGAGGVAEGAAGVIEGAGEGVKGLLEGVASGDTTTDESGEDESGGGLGGTLKGLFGD